MTTKRSIQTSCSIPPSPRWGVWSVMGLAVLMFVVAAGCGGAQSTADDEATVNPPRARYGNLPTGLRAEAADLNQDGVDDQFAYFQGSQLVYSARDLDFDGRVEMFEHYAGDGSVSEQEFQLDFDEAIDLVRFYRDGVLWRKEMSQSFDGQLSMVKTYDAAGNHLSTARDSDLDGRIDQWLNYEDGRLFSVGYDLDGDGLVDNLELVEED